MQIVNEENKSLRNEVDSLERKVPAKIEKTAREKYGMIRKGEKPSKSLPNNILLTPQSIWYSSSI